MNKALGSYICTGTGYIGGKENSGYPIKNKTLEAVVKYKLTLIPRVIDLSLRIVTNRNLFAEGLHLAT